MRIFPDNAIINCLSEEFDCAMSDKAAIKGSISSNSL